MLESFEDYLHANLNLLVELFDWYPVKKLPVYFSERYAFSHCSIFGQELLLVMPAKIHHDDTPKTIRKCVELLREQWTGEVVYVAQALQGYDKKRLIELKISFVVPGNQMYLPSLGFDLREHLKRLRTPEVKRLTPAAQVVMLFVLYNWRKDGFIPTFLASKLKYSQMTLTRVFNEYLATDIGCIEFEGRKRVLRFQENRGAVWQKILPLLRNPVKQRVKIMKPAKSGLAVAGFSALGHYGKALQGGEPVYAVGKGELKRLETAGVIRYPGKKVEGEIAELEIWSYPPTLFARQMVVDPLSLYLSFGSDLNEGELETDTLEILKKFRKYIAMVMKSGQ